MLLRIDTPIEVDYYLHGGHPALRAARAAGGVKRGRGPTPLRPRLSARASRAVALGTHARQHPLRRALPLFLLAGLCLSSLDATAKYLVRDHVAVPRGLGALCGARWWW